ncbi:Hypothetical predicted protein [Pelobates cultripes]|uniref:Uncharacterized protein n=1 Tax=Pelobates cultripes TaxID=61616 RepID=A0AAD1WP07_PELCU|nr:Hypothetical predicted protein [Pelobates cultripes]
MQEGRGGRSPGTALAGGGDPGHHPGGFQAPSRRHGCAADASVTSGNTPKMADATSTLNPGAELLSIDQRLKTLFDTFWSKLQGQVDLICKCGNSCKAVLLHPVSHSDFSYEPNTPTVAKTASALHKVSS